MISLIWLADSFYANQVMQYLTIYISHIFYLLRIIMSYVLTAYLHKCINVYEAVRKTFVLTAPNCHLVVGPRCHTEYRQVPSQNRTSSIRM